MTPEDLNAARAGVNLEQMSDAGVAYNLDRKAFRAGTSQIRPSIAGMNPDQQKAAYEFWRQLYESPDTEFAGLFDELAKEYRVKGNVEAIVAPADGNTPSVARAFHETQKAAQEAVRDLKGVVRARWDEVSTLRLDPAKERALDAWAKEFARRTTEARATAIGYATDVRDFALHNYGKRYGLDLVAGLVYPYQFWYSRTYAKWMQRLAMNPYLLAEYGRYRKNLEIRHSGLPDWWKQSINTNELLGLDSANPMWLNLEQLVNPMNGLTGVDFNDPKKRVDQFTTTVDGLNKFGPSIWTPFSLAIAFNYHMKGQEDAASRWAGRLWQPTRTIRDLTALAGWNKGMGVELDPLTNFFGDPYEDARVGRALPTLAPKYGWAAVNEAGRLQSGPIWEEAKAIAINTRAPDIFSIVAPFFLGTGAKPRTKIDIQIDQMYSSINTLINSKSTMTPEEYRRSWDSLRMNYPFMDSVLISKRSGADRDEAFAWNVLSRIPPGGSRALYERAGLTSEAADAFYESKGDLTKLSEADREKFMGGILALSAILEMPDNVTRGAWNGAKSLYRQVEAQGEQVFGTGIWDRTDIYYAKKAYDAADARAYLVDNPVVQQALDWKQAQIMANPIMSSYYASQSSIEIFFKEKFLYEPARQELGPDIFTKLEIHDRIASIDTASGKRYWADHPELRAYRRMQSAAGDAIDAAVAAAVASIPEGMPEVYRAGVQPSEETSPSNASEAIDREVAAYLGGMAPEEVRIPTPQAPVQVSWQQWQGVLGPSLSNLLADYIIQGEPLPESAIKQLERIGEDTGVGNAWWIVDMVRLVIPR